MLPTYWHSATFLNIERKNKLQKNQFSQELVMLINLVSVYASERISTVDILLMLVVQSLYQSGNEWEQLASVV